MLLLQIASGKLFTQSPGQRNELRGIVHTNLRLLGKEPIETVAGRLLPTNTTSPHCGQLVYEFTELMEQPPAAGVVVSHGIDPYLYDFAAIVSLILNVTCTVAPEAASRLTSRERHTKVGWPPREFIPRMFDDHVWCQEDDATKLIKVVRDLIELQRESFLAAMRAIRTYVAGLHRLVDDTEVAYVLLVASIESLAQKFDEFRPEWNDYDDTKRKKIDNALRNADKDTSQNLREALLETEHHSLARRFREFTVEHLQSSYFREETIGIESPASRADLAGALREAYVLRSRYIHNLHELPSQLAMGTFRGETIEVERRTFLTFRGMARLARHVILEFIRRQPKVAKEPYDYSLERFGIVQMQMAPQYWIGNAENVDPTSGTRRLEGFLSQVTACFNQVKDATITDLHPMLRKVEAIFPTIDVNRRRPFLAIYLLYNSLLSADKKMSNLKKVEEQYGSEMATPSIEGMLVHLIMGTIPDWPLIAHQDIHQKYFQQRERKTGLKVTCSLEAGISLALAERFRLDEDVENARKLIELTVENYPGHESLQDFERTFNPAETIHWNKVIFPQRNQAVFISKEAHLSN